MATSAQHIINSLEAKYPQVPFENIINRSDVDIEGKISTFRQFIFGVTLPDQNRPSVDIQWYIERIKQKLAPFGDNVHTLGWPFEEHETKELKDALHELAKTYNADLDVEAIVNDITKKGSNYYYLAVTVVEIPIIFAA